MTNKKISVSVPDFEGTLKKLETIVKDMEGPELNLEQALKHFEQGISLARQCQEALRQAEQRVQLLIVEQEKPLADDENEA